jgi:hypothetical protein
MVKNASGGNKAKGFARKNFAKKDTPLRLSEDELELYAQVTKVHGGAMCQVSTLEGTDLLCHIRGKFRGRGKRDNFIGNGTWLLVGLRDWEKEPAPGKLSNCDVIEVYNDADKIRLKNNITTENWTPFINYDIKNIRVGDDCDDDGAGIEFADEKTQEYQELIEAQVAAAQEGKSNALSLSTDDSEEIDVDDI